MDQNDKLSNIELKNYNVTIQEESKIIGLHIDDAISKASKLRWE